MVVRKNIDTIIFDLDGTLHDLDIDWPAIKGQLGLKKGENFQDFMRQSKEAELPYIYKTLDDAERLGFGAGFRDAVIQKLEDIATRYSIVIFSRNSESVITDFLKDASPQLGDKIIVVGRKAGQPLKPDIASLFERVSLLKNAVVIGDTSHDVEVAKKLEVPCIIVHNKRNQYTPEGADKYVYNLNEAIDFIEEISKSQYE